MRKRLLVSLTVPALLLSGAVAADADPSPLNPAPAPTALAKPYAPTTTRLVAQNATAATTVTSVWRVFFGGYYTSNPPTVYTNRNPTWFTGGNPGLTFTTGGDFQDAATFCTHGLCWHTGTAPSLVAMLRWARDCNTFIQGHNGDVPWATNVSLGDTCAGQMILWNNGCLETYWWTGYQWNTAWKNSDNPACAIYLS